MSFDVTMFQIYREASYGRKYRVVYFTELNEHNKELEIARAAAGEHVADGYLKDHTKPEAKRIIARFVERLNQGEAADIAALRQDLEPYRA